MNLFDLETYNYILPKELIAKVPLEPRDASRLMIVRRKTGEISEIPFREIVDLLESTDQLIFNDTKVIPARLIGHRTSGGKVEIFLVRPLDDRSWEVMVRPGKKCPVGTEVQIAPQFSCVIDETLKDGNKRVHFVYEGDLNTLLKQYGQIPLPHYMERDATAQDSERYQTVYASKEGAVAAPTAGLHFTHELLDRIRSKGVDTKTLTLHVGLGTFKPITASDIREHKMHQERFMIQEPFNAKGRRICVGTTTCRAVESVILQQGAVVPGAYETQLFITPGFKFQFTDALITNFHLPQSSLLILVSAFAGLELIQEAYRKAIKDRFRFYSYGDAMLIL